MRSHITRVKKKGKLYKIGFLVLMALSLMLPGKGFALPFSSTGWVDPNSGNSWNSSTLEGTARYSIYINTPGVNVNGGGIEFEDDIFDLSVLDLSDVTFLAPPSWGTMISVALDSNLANNTTSVKWTLGGGVTSVTDATDPIVIEVKYKLLSASRYNFGNNSFAGDLVGWEWDEAQGANQSWSQRYLLVGTDANPVPFNVAVSGGSTAQVVTAQVVPVPEPGTLLLLGSGLLGCVALARLRGKKTNG